MTETTTMQQQTLFSDFTTQDSSTKCSIPQHCGIEIFKPFLDPVLAESLFEQLLNEIHWQQPSIQLAGKKIPIVLIGNKIDLRDQFKDNPVMQQTIVTTAEGESLAGRIRDRGVHTSFLETSAKTGHNVEASFLELAIKILEAGGLT